MTPTKTRHSWNRLWVVTSLWLLSSSLLRGETDTAGRELIRDPHFQNGFVLLKPEPGQRVVYGEAVPVTAPARPVWHLGQWSSKFPLAAARQERLPDGRLLFTNSAKRVGVGPGGSAEADLALGVSGSIEYGSRARKTQEEPWVHLLVQQDLAQPPALAELASCRFQVEARLKHARLLRTDDYTPARHAAQFFVYFTIANRNPQSAGYSQYYWFGIPVYDDRHRVIPAYQARDFGETKQFIYTPASDVFATNSTHGGEWVVFAKDLLPLMREGLETGWKRGFMPGSRELADYRLTGVFIGWEVPGVFDVEMQIRDLSLWAVSRKQPGASTPGSKRGR